MALNEKLFFRDKQLPLVDAKRECEYSDIFISKFNTVQHYYLVSQLIFSRVAAALG